MNGCWLSYWALLLKGNSKFEFTKNGFLQWDKWKTSFLNLATLKGCMGFLQRNNSKASRYLTC